jgi:hypothetical protein
MIGKVAIRGSLSNFTTWSVLNETNTDWFEIWFPVYPLLSSLGWCLTCTRALIVVFSPPLSGTTTTASMSLLPGLMYNLPFPLTIGRLVLNLVGWRNIRKLCFEGSAAWQRDRVVGDAAPRAGGYVCLIYVEYCHVWLIIGESTHMLSFVIL